MNYTHLILYSNLMKKYLWVICVLCALTANAQDKTKPSDSSNVSEIKINGLLAVVGAMELSYERSINEESAFGVSVLVPYDSSDTSLNYYVSPYYRWYFGNKYSAGFFLEGFGMLNSEDVVEITVNGNGFNSNLTSRVDFALGIGIGGKWVSKRGFVGELNLGFGRNLFNSAATGTELVGKIGITLGYRF